jgi:hypothetical protein
MTIQSSSAQLLETKPNLQPYPINWDELTTKLYNSEDFQEWLEEEDNEF